MKKIMLLAALLCNLSVFAQPTVSGLKVNRLNDPQGVDDASPAFSWIIDSDQRNVSQAAYEVAVYEGGKKVWGSGKVASSESINVQYQGPALKPSTKYFWQVRVWDNNGRQSKWSPRASWVSGMLSTQEWKASWIEPVVKSSESPLMRKTFVLSKPVASAVAYITAHGMYEAYINGQKVGNAHYAPGWTTYNKRLQYQAYDVTSMLTKGGNAIGLMLGYGWYHSLLGWVEKPEKKLYDIDTMGALAQIVVTYKDGSQEFIVTDGSWKTAMGEIVSSTIYGGETVDARRAVKGWNTVGFDDSSWTSVNVAEYPSDNLVPSESEPVVTHKVLKPVKVITTPKGEKVLDFGQNLVGREILRYKGTPGQEIVISHAEVLDENGNFYTQNLRSAKAQSRFICSGEEDCFEPLFTFYGFRYLKVEGIEGELDPENFSAAVVFSDMPENGNFSSSNPMVNQLQSNIQWGLAGNFIDVPTDCPQRDERLGWTGDAQVFFRTATFNRDVQNFFRKWLKDLALDQDEAGRVPDVVPNIPKIVGAGRVGWADAATVIPWQHYMAYADKTILEDQYVSMKAWVDFMVGESENNLWNKGWHYGDWLFFSRDNDCNGVSAVTYTPLIQQCYFAHSASLVAKAADVLGKADDVAKYSKVAADARKAFCDNYLTPSGMLVSSTQTAYVLALNFDMLPEQMRPLAAKHLADNVEKYGHITTGFLGTPCISHVLSSNGYNELAYRLLLRQDYPGWLYPVRMGATTIWERWNSMMPDGSIPDNGMNSFNHYSYGAVGDWLYRDAVGLYETSPGFKTLAVKPHPGADFTYMKAEQQTPYGKAAASWQKVDGVFTLEVTVPVNTTAEIFIPSEQGAEITMDGGKMDAVPGLKMGAWEGGYQKVTVGSGTYKFSAALR